VGNNVRRELQADPVLVAAAMATIPNPDVHYNEWVHKAYAVAGATGGTGYDILCNWSAKSSKHDDGETEALWGRVSADEERCTGSARAAQGPAGRSHIR
jgi:Primase C terminal 2 (PriCT-2)